SHLGVTRETPPRRSTPLTPDLKQEIEIYEIRCSPPAMDKPGVNILFPHDAETSPRAAHSTSSRTNSALPDRSNGRGRRLFSSRYGLAGNAGSLICCS